MTISNRSDACHISFFILSFIFIFILILYSLFLFFVLHILDNTCTFICAYVQTFLVQYVHTAVTANLILFLSHKIYQHINYHKKCRNENFFFNPFPHKQWFDLNIYLQYLKSKDYKTTADNAKSWNGEFSVILKKQKTEKLG